MKNYFYILFVCLGVFIFCPVTFVYPLTDAEKANKCINERPSNKVIMYLCQRYGLDIKEYEKVFTKEYFNNLSLPNFILLTIPKTGTHLTGKIIALIIGKTIIDGSFINKSIDVWKEQLFEHTDIFPFCHIGAGINPLYKFCLENGFKAIINQRDTRDQMVASIFGQDKIAEASGIYNDFSMVEKLRQNMKGCFAGPFCLFSGTDLYKEIKRLQAIGLVVKFENLVGPKGGGDLYLQRLEINKIANYLNITLNEQQLNYICTNLWGYGDTFRKGIIGDWKNYFTEEIKEEFIERGGGIVLIENGYEKDYNW